MCFKKLFCRHKNQICITNIYGNLINHMNCRSVWQCERCGKYFYNNKLEPRCETINFLKSRKEIAVIGFKFMGHFVNWAIQQQLTRVGGSNHYFLDRQGNTYIPIINPSHLNGRMFDDYIQVDYVEDDFMQDLLRRIRGKM